MPEPILELTPENTAGWPATPDQERMEQALTTLTVMEAASGFSIHSIGIPARVPEEERPKDIIEVPTPDSRTTSFDAYHQRRIHIPDQIIMKDRKVRNAQALHDCLQAAAFSQACAELFNQTAPQGPDQTSWFVHTAANLGDSTHTIGIAIQRPNPDLPGKDITVVTKVPRNKHWMGYNANIQNLKGLTFRIFGALDVAHLPSYVIGCPSEREFEGVTGTPVRPAPKREVGMLAKILKYHGADECLWIPSDRAAADAHR